MGSRVSSLEDAYFMNSTRMCIASFDAYGVAFEHHASSGRACVPTRVDRSAQRTLTWHRIRSIGRGGFEEYAEDPACCLLDGYTRFLLNAELRENSMLLIRKHRRSGANASSRHLHLLGTTWASIAPPETPHQVSVACSHTARCECRLAADSGPAQAAATASGRLFSASCVTLQVGDPESHFRFIYKGRYAWFCIEQKGPSPGDLTRNEAYAFMQMHRPHRERRSWISETHLATGTKRDVVLGVCFHCHELMPRKGRSSGGLFYWWTSTKTRLIHGSGIANVSSC